MHDTSIPTLGQGPGRGEEAARRIEAAVQRSLDAAAQQAEAGARQAEAQAQAHGSAVTVPGEPGTVFRVGPGGELIQVAPGPGAEPGAVDLQVEVPPPDMPPFLFEPRIPQEAVVIAIAFFIMIAVIAVGLPIARAVARRMDRSAPAPEGPSAEQAVQLRHIQTAVDAMAVEIERISENQRYVTRLLTEGTPAGVPRLEAAARDAMPLEASSPRR